MVFGRKKKFDNVAFPESIEVEGSEYLIEVVFSPKRSSSVVIRDNVLVFRMSSYLSAKQAHEHFATLLKRIYKNVIKNEQSKGLTVNDVLERGYFHFANTRYEVVLKKIRGVKFAEDVFYVGYSVKPENLEKHIIKYLTLRYSNRISEYVKKVNSGTFNFKYKEVVLKLVRSKWGHCTADNIVMLNLKLLNAPIEVLDYVIIHELAHVKVKNHSERFWREVARFCPNYKQLKSVLRKSPPSIFMKDV